MKMKKLIAVAMVALLGSLVANATVVFNDTYNGLTAVMRGDINADLGIRQAGGTTSSTYTGGGGILSGDPNPNALSTLYYDLYSFDSLWAPVSGDYVTLDLDTDFGSSLAGNEWTIDYLEVLQAGEGPGNWGGWAGLFIGSTRGFGAELGVLFRPGGEWSVFNGFNEVGSGGAGDLVGEDGYSFVNVTFDEGNNSVSVSQGGFDMGTYAMTFNGGSRFVQFRTHFDGDDGTCGSVDTLRDDLVIEVIPEPATLGLFALIGGGMLWIRKRMTR